jgi:hypothetical protein
MVIVIQTTEGRKDPECIHVYASEILHYTSFRSE